MPAHGPCPNCSGELVGLDRSGVRIDACRQCRGVWLDRGELDQILERERGGAHDDDDFLREMSGSSSGHGGGHSSHGHRRKKRKKSLFEELFD